MSHHLDTPLAAQTGNASEAMLSLAAGMAVPSGLRSSIAAAQRTSDFPYVVPA